ncbi:MAG: diguanylate cyclase [Roseovarius sp.]|uniref:diguanylate cyclase n=1 Tax=Roseovarius sp. TaxID=1486281 RepID=UPI0032ECD4B1
MTGRILIVDALATNRIVLKVTLSAAFYRVIQAGSGHDALGLARRARPDVVIAGDLPDIPLAEFATALQAATGTPAPPLVALLPDDHGGRRIGALRAGAADVITKPYDENVLLARLRSIMRHRQIDSDLGMPADTFDALGFAEEPAAFQPRQSVAVLAATRPQAEALRARLAAGTAHDIMALGLDEPGTAKALRRRPDAIVLQVGSRNTRPGLSLLAELQAAPSTRRARVLALLDPDVMHLAAPILDMGAHDALPDTTDDLELSLRLSFQLSQKSRGDALRHKLEDGLQAAVSDPLTGLYNRRYALSYVKRMLTAAQDTGQTCAVLVADLDHFKSVNDTHGHAAGDAVLAQVSARMRAALPADSMIARIGGEEFLIALPGTSLAEVRDLADRLRRVVRDTAVPLACGGPVRVTVSIGASLATPGPAGPKTDVAKLVAEADKALYGSKNGGRDTVTVCRRPAA